MSLCAHCGHARNNHVRTAESIKALADARAQYPDTAFRLVDCRACWKHPRAQYLPCESFVEPGGAPHADPPRLILVYCDDKPRRKVRR